MSTDEHKSETQRPECKNSGSSACSMTRIDALRNAMDALRTHMEQGNDEADEAYFVIETMYLSLLLKKAIRERKQ